MTTYVTDAGDVIDNICHQYYGRTDGTVEAVLKANPHLRGQPTILPAGIRIELPEVAPTVPARIYLFS